MPKKTDSAYRRAGVDIAAGEAAVDRMRASVRSTFGVEVLTELGHFSGLYALTPRLGPQPGGAEPVLVASADGVGTKLRLALALGRHDSIGADLVNHCTNDILTCGARPLFFLDYFATGKLDPEQAALVVAGLAAACREVGAALIGGETAEMPGFYQPGDYDLAGFIVGLVDRRRMILGNLIAPGDLVLGLPAGGLHTNGYSLARQALGLTDPDPLLVRERLVTHEPRLGRPLGEALLEPHRCYLPLLAPLLDETTPLTPAVAHRLGPIDAPMGEPLIKGMAHITGGGLGGNISRILPPGTRVRLEWASWTRPPIFDLIAERGQIPVEEMPQVFNMGLGFILIVGPDSAATVLQRLPEALLVGTVEEHDTGPTVVISGLTSAPALPLRGLG
jgi:phosphoribosylformylglycinamidine cyclo-ligase